MLNLLFHIYMHSHFISICTQTYLCVSMYVCVDVRMWMQKFLVFFWQNIYFIYSLFSYQIISFVFLWLSYLSGKLCILYLKNNPIFDLMNSSRNFLICLLESLTRQEMFMGLRQVTFESDMSGEYAKCRTSHSSSMRVYCITFATCA